MVLEIMEILGKSWDLVLVMQILGFMEKSWDFNPGYDFFFDARLASLAAHFTFTLLYKINIFNAKIDLKSIFSRAERNFPTLVNIFPR